MASNRMRSWVGEAQYDGYRLHYIGGVSADSEMHALSELQRLWRLTSPHPFPDRVNNIPGSISRPLPEDTDRNA